MQGTRSPGCLCPRVSLLAPCRPPDSSLLPLEFQERATFRGFSRSSVLVSRNNIELVPPSALELTHARKCVLLRAGLDCGARARAPRPDAIRHSGRDGVGLSGCEKLPHRSNEFGSLSASRVTPVRRVTINLFASLA